MLANVETEILARYRIQATIKSLGITQREAADRCGIPYATFLNYIQGRTEITLPILRQIARALDTTPEALIATEPEYPPLSQEIAERAQHLSDADLQELLAIIRIKEQRARAAEGVACPQPNRHQNRHCNAYDGMIY